MLPSLTPTHLQIGSLLLSLFMMQGKKSIYIMSLFIVLDMIQEWFRTTVHHGELITENHTTKCTQLVDFRDLFSALWRRKPHTCTHTHTEYVEPPRYSMTPVCSQNQTRRHLVHLRSVSTKPRPVPRYVIFTHCDRLHNNHLLTTDEWPCFFFTELAVYCLSLLSSVQMYAHGSVWTLYTFV